MSELTLDSNFWNTRWENKDTAWDVGYASPALTDFFSQLENKAMKILIPGCGNAWEAEWLFKNGFTNVSVIDFAPEALKNFSQRVPGFPNDHLVCRDFFQHEGKYDLIIEQTFFCAIDPSLRKNYAKKMAELLVPGGRLAGLLFNDTLNNDKPPFGGTKDEYLGYFTPYFTIDKMEPCANSIPPRAGRELFFILTRN